MAYFILCGVFKSVRKYCAVFGNAVQCAHHFLHRRKHRKPQHKIGSNNGHNQQKEKRSQKCEARCCDDALLFVEVYGKHKGSDLLALVVVDRNARNKQALCCVPCGTSGYGIQKIIADELFNLASCGAPHKHIMVVNRWVCTSIQ